MGTSGQLKAVERQLIKDLMECTISLEELGRKYGVTRQAISLFAIKRGARRPKWDHTERCFICQQLMGIAKRHPSEFISCKMLYKKLKLGRVELSYHLNLLRENGFVSQHFGRIQSKKVELALQKGIRMETGPILPIPLQHTRVTAHCAVPKSLTKRVLKLPICRPREAFPTWGQTT